MNESVFITVKKGTHSFVLRPSWVEQWCQQISDVMSFLPRFLVIRTKQCNGGHYDEWRLAQEKCPAMSEQVNSSNIRLHKAVITDPETKFSGATWRRRTKITTWQLCPTHVTALVSWIMFRISGILFNFNFKSGVNHPEHWTDLVALQEAHTPLPHYEKKGCNGT